MHLPTVALLLTTLLTTGSLVSAQGTTIAGSSYGASQTIDLAPSSSSGFAPIITAGWYGVAGMAGLGAAALL